MENMFIKPEAIVISQEKEIIREQRRRSISLLLNLTHSFTIGSLGCLFFPNMHVHLKLILLSIGLLGSFLIYKTSMLLVKRYYYG